MDSEIINTSIIVVLYKTPYEYHLCRLRGLAAAGVCILLVDNTPNGIGSIEHSYTNEDFKRLESNIYYCSNGKNNGIGWALNKGINYSLINNIKYIFTFDQDSQFDMQLISAMLSKYNRLCKVNGFKLAIGPHPVNKISGGSYLRRLDRVRLLLKKIFKKEYDVLPVGELITSGLLASADTYRYNGLYNDSFFMDLHDFDWSWRLTRLGGALYVDMESHLAHLIGDGDVPLTFGMKLGAPLRLAYLFRNFTYLTKKGGVPMYDAVKFFVLIPLKLIAFLFVSDRWKRVGYIFAGLLYGFREKMGPIEGVRNEG